MKYSHNAPDKGLYIMLRVEFGVPGGLNLAFEPREDNAPEEGEMLRSFCPWLVLVGPAPACGAPGSLMQRRTVPGRVGPGLRRGTS